MVKLKRKENIYIYIYIYIYIFKKGPKKTELTYQARNPSHK